MIMKTMKQERKTNKTTHDLVFLVVRFLKKKRYNVIIKLELKSPIISLEELQESYETYNLQPHFALLELFSVDTPNYASRNENKICADAVPLA